MKTGSEKALRARLLEGLRPYGLLYPIESNIVGLSDITYLFEGVDGWIELKHGTAPVKSSTPVFKSQYGLKPEQITWIMLRRKHKGRSFILAQVDRHLFLFDGTIAPQFNSLTLGDMLSTCVWYHFGGMTVKDWQGLKGKLIEAC